MLFYLIIVSHSRIIGIDLGTTQSVVAVVENRNVTVIENEFGKRTTPSIVSFHNRRRYIGETALKLSTLYPESTIHSAKRIIGRKYSDTEVQNERIRLPFQIIDINDRPYFKIYNFTEDGNDITVSPEEVSGLILKKLKLMSEEFLKEKIHDAVVTVPAYFNEEQRKATVVAGKIAGINVRRVISEPTAAALAYGLNIKEDRLVIVYDLGGGTFDVSLLQIEDDIFEVIATGGDTHLGGEDFDEQCVQEMLNRFSHKYKEDFSNNPISMSLLKKKCEIAKIQLSEKEETTINIPNIYKDYDLNENFSRNDFVKINKHIFKRTLDKIEQVLSDANKTKTDINDVIMIGGSTRIPYIRKIVSEYFNNIELHTSINPDEAVAIGAAIQADILDSNRFGLCVVDVYPLTLGIETHGGLMSPIIPRNSRIPVTRSKIFTPHSDDAAGARIEIYEGERPLTKDNRALGVFELHGLPRAGRKQLQIQVIFSLDANAILHVTAKEHSSKTQESIHIDTLDLKLSDSEIEEAIASAELFCDDDKADKERIIEKLNLEDKILELMNMLKAEKSVITERLYNSTKKQLKSELRWLYEHPVENPEVYIKRGEELYRNMSFLLSRGHLPEL